MQTLRMSLARTNKMSRLLNRGPPLNVQRRVYESQFGMAGKSSLSGGRIRSPHTDSRLARMSESTAGTHEQRKSERRGPRVPRRLWRSASVTWGPDTFSLFPLLLPPTLLLHAYLHLSLFLYNSTFQLYLFFYLCLSRCLFPTFYLYLYLCLSNPHFLVSFFISPYVSGYLCFSTFSLSIFLNFFLLSFCL